MHHLGAWELVGAEHRSLWKLRQLRQLPWQAPSAPSTHHASRSGQLEPRSLVASLTPSGNFKMNGSQKAIKVIVDDLNNAKLDGSNGESTRSVEWERRSEGWFVRSDPRRAGGVVDWSDE